MFNARILIVWIAGVLALLCFGSCSSEGYLEDADQEVYGIIQEKQQAVIGTTAPFAIDRGENIEDLRREVDEEKSILDPEGGPAGESKGIHEELQEILGQRDGEQPLFVNLSGALKIAFRINRDFKEEKESLYLDALTLTFQRHLWTPQLSGSLSGEAGRTESGGVDQRYTSGAADFSFDQLLSTGGEIGLSFANDLLKVYSGGSTKTASSLLSFNFLQPLWRGFGSLVAKENLTQAERNVAYSIRSFERFKKSLAVDIASEYYNVLQQKDAVQNEYSNYQNLIKNRERAALMAQAGRMPELEVDQTRQQELNARNRWFAAKERYDQFLDSFKILLGLPTETPLDLDPKDLENLTVSGLVHPSIDPEKAMNHALQYRLDLMNTYDRVDDAKRRVLVAEDGLGPDLDFTLDYSIGTEAPTKPFKFRPRHPDYSAGLDLDLPLNRKNERNAFRQSLIDLERQKRNLSDQEDRIKQAVRQSYRTLELALESYEIQKQALALAEKRVESTNLLQEAGRAETRDVLESQDALLNAQNTLTSAVVDHTIARLEFLLNIESLKVTESGLIVSMDEEEATLETMDKNEKGPEEHEQTDQPSPEGGEG
ncbi:MAG: TolC family protein [Planctomycetes bacterium]|nr:TolC family protein [Planctomycetota bacterium]